MYSFSMVSTFILFMEKVCISLISMKHNMGINHQQVLETARQVASLPVSSTPIPYDQVKNQCESLVMGKQQKMSVLQSFKLQQDAKAIVLANEHENKMPNVVRICFVLYFPTFLLFSYEEEKLILRHCW
ncbi:hypothetical protein CsSME_00034475 [Camellia sinensis var. sinensis]